MKENVLKLAGELRRVPLTLVLAAVSIGAYLAPNAFHFFDLDLGSPANWTLVQVMGCHLLHWNADHLFWDLSMFVVLSAICERSVCQRYYWTLAVSGLLIPLIVGQAHPELSSYRGLSGLDTAIFSLLMMHRVVESRRSGDRLWKLYFLGWSLLCGKTVFEFLTGTVLFVNASDFSPIPVAHLVGAFIGLLFALPIKRLIGQSRRTGSSTLVAARTG